MDLALNHDHIALVRMLARKVRREQRARLDLADLEGAGLLGLVEASHRYRDGRGAAFSTFASYRIRGAMLDAIRKSRRQVVPEVTPAVARECPERDAIARQAGEKLRGAIGALPRRERHFIHAVYFEDRDINAAGALLGLSRSWSSRLHARAVGRLRKKLA